MVKLRLACLEHHVYEIKMENGEARIRFWDGRKDLTIPFNDGFPAKDGKGDLLATVRIMLPEGGDAELEELMRQWRKAKPYDPRKGMG